MDLIFTNWSWGKTRNLDNVLDTEAAVSSTEDLEKRNMESSIQVEN